MRRRRKAMISLAIAAGIVGGGIIGLRHPRIDNIQPRSATIVAHTIAGSADGNMVTTSPIATTGSNLAVVSSAFFANVCTPSDSSTNSWTTLTQSGTQPIAQISYVFQPTVGAMQTFSCTSGAGAIYPALQITALSGAVTSPFDVQGGMAGTTPISASLTTTGSNEIIIAACANNDPGGTPQITGTGLQPLDSINHSGLHQGLAVSLVNMAAAGPFTATCTTTDAGSGVALTLAAFRVTANVVAGNGRGVVGGGVF